MFRYTSLPSTAKKKHKKKTQTNINDEGSGGHVPWKAGVLSTSPPPIVTSPAKGSRPIPLSRRFVEIAFLDPPDVTTRHSAEQKSLSEGFWRSTGDRPAIDRPATSHVPTQKNSDTNHFSGKATQNPVRRQRLAQDRGVSGQWGICREVRHLVPRS